MPESDTQQESTVQKKKKIHNQQPLIYLVLTKLRFFFAEPSQVQFQTSSMALLVYMLWLLLNCTDPLANIWLKVITILEIFRPVKLQRFLGISLRLVSVKENRRHIYIHTYTYIYICMHIYIYIHTLFRPLSIPQLIQYNS